MLKCYDELWLRYYRINVPFKLRENKFVGIPIYQETFSQLILILVAFNLNMNL